MITVKNLRKSFDGKTILNDVSMSFREGECNMLIGASGSGKTVLLNMLIGLFEPDSGEIWYDNQEFTKLSEQEKNRHNRRWATRSHDRRGGSPPRCFRLCT